MCGNPIDLHAVRPRRTETGSVEESLERVGRLQAPLQINEAVEIYPKTPRYADLIGKRGVVKGIPGTVKQVNGASLWDWRVARCGSLCRTN